MTHKQVLLFFILSIASILSGATFGLLDVFGFIDGRHAISFTLLIGSAALLYISLIAVFLLDIAHPHKITSYLLVCTLFFGTTFFLMNLNIVLAIIAVIGYCALLIHSSKSISRRFKDFVRFVPQEIFFPVLRNGFLFILVLLSLLAYGQSQKLITEHTLVTPQVVRIIMKPSVTMLNQQVNSQLQSEVGDTLAQLPESERVQAVQLMLRKTVENMADKKTGAIYGIPEEEVPINMAQVSGDGKVDLTPVFEGMLPIITATLNARLTQYALIAPLFIALFTFLIFQPLIIPIQIAESLLTLFIFKVLLTTKFLKLHKESVEVDRLSL